MDQAKADYANTVFQVVEELVWKHDITYLEAVILYCEESGQEIEIVGDALRHHDPFKAKIELDAEKLNYLKRKSRLDDL